MLAGANIFFDDTIDEGMDALGVINMLDGAGVLFSYDEEIPLTIEGYKTGSVIITAQLSWINDGQSKEYIITPSAAFNIRDQETSSILLRDLDESWSRRRYVLNENSVPGEDIVYIFEKKWGSDSYEGEGFDSSRSLILEEDGETNTNLGQMLIDMKDLANSLLHNVVESSLETTKTYARFKHHSQPTLTSN